MTTEQTYREVFIEVAALAIRDHFRSVLILLGSTAREYASQLYGMLIERNGPFGAIAIAAHEAIIAILTGTDCPDHWHCDPASAPHRCGVDRAKPCATCGAFVFDPTDFIRAIVTEALGGAKVEEAYGKILVLPAPHLSHHEQLSVPHLVIEGA